MWSWAGLNRDTAESRSAPRVTAVTSSSIRSVFDAFWTGLCVDSAVTAAARNSFATGRITPPRPVLGRRGYATRVMLEGERAAGIEYKCRGAIQKVRADREVVLSAGAFATCSTV